jgi:hypothetical protein
VTEEAGPPEAAETTEPPAPEAIEPPPRATESTLPEATEPPSEATEPTEPEPQIAPAATEPPIAPVPPTEPPPVESTRRLIGASFDLLNRSSDEMRRASFYIGLVLLGTVGPLALANWALEVVALHKTNAEMDSILAGGAAGWLAFLGSIAIAGVLVAAIESRTMATALLGGRLIGRPLSVRGSLARSRMSFWRVVIGSFVVAIPVAIAQFVLGAVFEATLGRQTDVSIVSTTLTAALVGAPFAYVLSGIVLGDVDPFEAARRSFRVFRARKAAAALVAVFETAATLLVVIGLSAGLDIAVRIFGALGLGTNSGPAGLALMTLGIMAGVFALGTLIYTAYAIAVAPQIVMFVGLTRATFGLDHVRPGGDRDPASVGPGRRRFRWLTIPMLIGFAGGLIGLGAFVVFVSE